MFSRSNPPREFSHLQAFVVQTLLLDLKLLVRVTGYSQLLEGSEVGGLGVTCLEEERSEGKKMSERSHEHMTRRNSKYLGYTTGHIVRPAVRRIV